MKGYCQICGTEIEVQMCCSAYDCGCMGQPVEPPVCSEKCFDQYMSQTPTPTITKLQIDIDGLFNKE